MTEDVKDQQANDEEFDLLKARAKQMGLKHHWNIGKDKLKEQVNAALAPPPVETTTTQKEVKQVSNGERPPPKNDLERAQRAAKATPAKEIGVLTPKQRGSRQVRIRVNCMNPNKQEWEGEIFTVGNSEMGFKKYVPFNNDAGWHVPYMIYKHLKERKCQIFVTSKDDRGNKTRVGKLVNEFAVELMDPLTKQELQELGQRQAMADGTTV